MPVRDLVPDTLDKTTQLIANLERQIELLRELQDSLQIAAAANVNPREISKVCYRAPTKKEYAAWSTEARDRILYSSSIYCDSHQVNRGVVNVVTLRDGRELYLAEPVFLRTFNQRDYGFRKPVVTRGK